MRAYAVLKSMDHFIREERVDLPQNSEYLNELWLHVHLMFVQMGARLGSMWEWRGDPARIPTQRPMNSQSSSNNTELCRWRGIRSPGVEVAGRIVLDILINFASAGPSND